MADLTAIKVLLGNPDGSDDLLNTIVTLTESRLLSLLGTEAVPDELSYIVTEVSIMRFNRIGSEGYTSHSVEGESIGLSENDFALFMDDIATWKTRNDVQDSRRVHFL